MADDRQSVIIFSARDETAAAFAAVRGSLNQLGDSVSQARALMLSLAGAPAAKIEMANDAIKRAEASVRGLFTQAAKTHGFREEMSFLDDGLKAAASLALAANDIFYGLGHQIGAVGDYWQRQSALVFARYQTDREQAIFQEFNTQRQKNEAVVQMEYRTWQLGAEFLQVFAGKSKAAAIAVIAINKALAIAQTIQATAVATMRAFRAKVIVERAKFETRLALAGWTRA